MNPQALPSMLANSMGQGVAAPQQVTQSSPNYDPALEAQPNIPTPLHKAFIRRGKQLPVQLQQAPSQAPAQQPAPAQQSQMPISEVELILKALSSRLKLLGDHESHVRDYLMPKKEEPSPK